MRRAIEHDVAAGPRAGAWWRGAVMFPDQYCWYVLVCALDLMVTSTIIARMNGVEVNGIAQRVIEAGGLPGLTAFKFATAIVVVMICEYVGRRRAGTGRRLAEWAVAISAVPVLVGLGQIGAGVAAGRLPV